MTRRRRNTDEDGALSNLMLQVLLILAEGEQHGYAMMLAIEERSQTPFRIGPATLYRTLKRLTDAGLINEIDDLDHAQRRRYRITDSGRRRAALEAGRLAGIVEWARAVRVLRSESS